MALLCSYFHDTTTYTVFQENTISCHLANRRNSYSKYMRNSSIKSWGYNFTVQICTHAILQRLKGWSSTFNKMKLVEGDRLTSWTNLRHPFVKICKENNSNDIFDFILVFIWDHRNSLKLQGGRISFAINASYSTLTNQLIWSMVHLN